MTKKYINAVVSELYQTSITRVGATKHWVEPNLQKIDFHSNAKCINYGHNFLKSNVLSNSRYKHNRPILTHSFITFFLIFKTTLFLVFVIKFHGYFVMELPSQVNKLLKYIIILV